MIRRTNDGGVASRGYRRRTTKVLPCGAVAGGEFLLLRPDAAGSGKNIRCALVSGRADALVISTGDGGISVGGESHRIAECQIAVIRVDLRLLRPNAAVTDENIGRAL